MTSKKNLKSALESMMFDEMCGNSRQQAMTWLIDLEMLTAP